MVDPRGTLQRLIDERGDDYASLSRMLGRNPAYIQQFIRRGVPRKLDENDRRTLARYFGVSEEVLGAPDAHMPNALARSGGPAARALVFIPFFSLQASAGAGSLVEDHDPAARLGFDARFLRSMTQTPDLVSAIRVSGDSMVPTLFDEDIIFVDRGDAAARLRDGIYVLRVDDSLLVKRIALYPWGGALTVGSDNPAYPPWPECRRDRINVIGRVIWSIRKFG